MDGPAADGQHWENVRLARVPYHGDRVRFDAMVGKHPAVRVGILFGDDLDVPEEVGNAAAVDFAQLIAKVTLGDY